MGGRPYQPTGFRLDAPVEAGDIFYYPAAAVTIVKGDALHDDGAGLATNAVTAFAATFLGIAAEDAVASAALVPIIRPNPKLAFWVGNASATVAAATDRGEQAHG